MTARASVPDGVLDTGALEAVEARLAGGERARHAAHAAALRDALELQRLYDDAGMDVLVPSQLALVWGCSETRALSALQTASVLSALPGGFDLLAAAVMTVEQAGAVGRVLQPLDQQVRAAVWERAKARLVADAEQGVHRPPARLTEQLWTWAVQVDPEAAIERRRRAEAEGSVLLQRRDDGLANVLLSGLTLPLADAVLSRITALAVPFGADDDRTAGKLRLDAAVDLLLGRTGRPAGECAPAGGPLPFPDADADADADDDGDGSCSGGCGCPLGAAVPCGAQVTVLVPLATALGHGDVPAQTPGGPLEPDLLAALLSAAPVLRGVWVDPDGVPVADSPIVVRPERGDAESVRWALRRIVEAGPGGRQPGHRDDHARDDSGEAAPPEDEPPDDRPPDDGPDGRPPGGSPPTAAPTGECSAPPEEGAVSEAEAVPPTRPRGSLRRPGLLGRPHPPGTPGPYGPPGRLRRFLHARAPRCEWPGCGARAARCDLDHDLAHPHGPTCACNLGPLCRRHHRAKQAGFTKQRTSDGVLWTGPTRQQTLSPSQHLDIPAVRPARSVNPSEQLSPRQQADVLRPHDPRRDQSDGHPDWQVEDRHRAHRWWRTELRALRRALT